VVLFLFTGSVMRPLRAPVLNGLSLSAASGIVVGGFQQGHLSGLLGFTPAPTDTSMSVLIFCVAFGLSMDYEVFLISRIKKSTAATRRPSTPNIRVRRHCRQQTHRAEHVTLRWGSGSDCPPATGARKRHRSSGNSPRPRLVRPAAGRRPSRAVTRWGGFAGYSAVLAMLALGGHQPDRQNR
jgi:MMPL family protein